MKALFFILFTFLSANSYAYNVFSDSTGKNYLFTGIKENGLPVFILENQLKTIEQRKDLTLQTTEIYSVETLLESETLDLFCISDYPDFSFLLSGTQFIARNVGVSDFLSNTDENIIEDVQINIKTDQNQRILFHHSKDLYGYIYMPYINPFEANNNGYTVMAMPNLSIYYMFSLSIKNNLIYGGCLIKPKHIKKDALIKLYGEP